MRDFIARYADRVVGLLHGFDRLVFRGTLRHLSYVSGLASVLGREGVLLKEFGAWAAGLTARVKETSYAAVEALGRPVQYVASPSASKEEIARGILERDPVESGPVCLLTAVEPCLSFDIHRSRERRRLELVSRHRKCLHLYLYLQHPVFGFCHIRLQTWLPFQVQVCLNGREWLARQMDRAGLAYRREGNVFTWVEDLARAGRLVAQQLATVWPRALDALRAQIHPLHDRLLDRCRFAYYWTTHQMEWATDVVFRRSSQLAEVYPLLVHHAMVHLGSHDVLRFLGSRLPARFDGEVASDYKRRHEGVRVKHRANLNSVKIYDKMPHILRVETTIQRASDLKAWRPKEGDPDGPCSWRHLRKGVADLHRLTQLCQSSNERYLDALAEVDPDDATPLHQVLADVTRPRRWKDRPVRALRPCAKHDGQLLEAVCRGEHHITGFRNRDLYRILHGEQRCTERQRRRRVARITRLIRILRAHGLVSKIPKTHRYLATRKGRRVLTACVALRKAPLSLLTTGRAA